MNNIVAGIVKVIIAQVSPEKNGRLVEETAHLLYRRILGMPCLLRWPVILLTYGFDVLGVFFTGRFFQAMNAKQQAQYLYQWQCSPVSIARDLYAFYVKMTMFIFYSLCPAKS